MKDDDAGIGEMQPLVEVRDLHTCFSTRRNLLGKTTAWRRAVDGVSFTIPRKTTLGLVGESGCGKTTLGRTILRLLPHTSGTVLVDGVDVFEASGKQLHTLRRTMQMVFQDPLGSLNPRMTAGQIVAEPLGIHRTTCAGSRQERVAELMERVGLRRTHVDNYPHELSGGQRQRLSIARALVLDPKFVVCDEPVSALDVSVQARILNLLNDLKNDLELTYLFISHNLAVINHISDRVAVMFGGKLVEMADADDIHRRPGHPYTITLLSSMPGSQASEFKAPPCDNNDSGAVGVAHSGCVFYDRCPLRTDECRQVVPPLKSHKGLGPNHFVACHRAEDVLAGELLVK